tara:strand:+ start:132 stop:1019 length:888 start_codon:yes stop_codon:yes gene_type:complete
MKKSLDKAVIPVAGLGTRMLPATKAIPKEMLPILDKPIIQYVVEECILAGFKEIILITHSSKNSIENHFDTSFELESTLEKRIKKSLLKEIRLISKLNISIVSIRQSEALGLGHAILQAKNIIGNNPFAVVLPDRVMNLSTSNAKTDNLAEMRKNYFELKRSIILVEKVLKREIENYGIASFGKKVSSKNLKEIIDIVEKPKIKKAPSNMAVVGRYILEPGVFEFIEENKKSNKEIELTDAIRAYINSGEKVYASFLKGECFDCGNKEGYFKSILKTGLERPEFRKEIIKLVKNL